MSGLAPDWWPSRLAFLDSPIEADGLARLAEDVVPGGAARVHRRLDGGMESAVHLIELVDRTGRLARAVLKRRESFAESLGREWAALNEALPSRIATPEPISYDPDGRWFGVPALVMSHLPGSPRLAMSDDVADLAQLASALAAVHDCDGGGLEDAQPRWRREPPDDASAYEAAVWERIFELAADAGPAATLTHGDFHPGNTLWNGGRLAGVIDWENGERGWPAEDVAKCRWYLHLVHGRVTADDFLRAYQSDTAKTVDLLPLCEASYGVGVLRRTEQRAFFLQRSGSRRSTPAPFARRPTR